MILRHLHVKNLKLLRDFELSFLDAHGQPRMWTVIIGENGTAKTSLLQAIAMTAAGALEVNSLAKKVTGQLRDRRQSEPMEITATFGFTDLPAGAQRSFPGLGESQHQAAHVQLRSTVTLEKGSSSLRARAEYAPPLETSSDPLEIARDKNLPHWFVAGYGITRALPDPSRAYPLEQPSIERMEPLFDSQVALTSTTFANYFQGQNKGTSYTRALKRVLFHTERLLPNIQDLELRGRGHVNKAGDLVEGNRFRQKVGNTVITVPATALSHGYQSTIAWIADLVGHFVLEAEGEEIRPEDMQGLVLIDEIDLYLHPTWQLVLVSALRETFPRLQFVATTHSPLVLAGLRPDEIVRLRFTERGDVERADADADARLMTGTEIYREFFGIDDIIPDATGQQLRDFRYLAANPYRSDEDDRTITQLREALQRAGVDPELEPVPRRAP